MHSQRKGANAERELATVLREMGFPEARRTAAMYATGKDAPDLAGVPGLHIECKRVERLNLSQAMKQSQADARADEIPTVIHRRNRETWHITVRIADLPRLAETIARALRHGS